MAYVLGREGELCKKGLPEKKTAPEKSFLEIKHPSNSPFGNRDIMVLAAWYLTLHIASGEVATIV